jgi:hypothetical protein
VLVNIGVSAYGVDEYVVGEYWLLIVQIIKYVYQ